MRAGDGRNGFDFLHGVIFRRPDAILQAIQDLLGGLGN